MDFLVGQQRRPLSQATSGLTPVGLYIGPGDLGLEVAVYDSTARPSGRLLQDAWRARRGGRAVPLLVVALHGERAWVCGPTGEDLPILADRDVSVIQRLVAAALKQPNRHAALLFLSQALPSLETVAPGLRNEGLFALHELTADAPRRPGWSEHQVRARAIAGAEGRDLLQRLGYAIDRLDNVTMLLRGKDRRLALAVLLDQSEVPEAGNPKFSGLSPVSYAFTKADAENLDWVVVVQGDRLRLYPTKTEVGVGRRGRTETYLELQTSLLSDDHVAYLSLIFSPEALQPGGSVAELLDASKRFAADLAKALRDRIYTEVVPNLAKGVVAARSIKDATAEELDLTYRMALTILFRLLFVAYAEDRDLLPYRHSEAYRNRSLKRKAQELAEHARGAVPPSPGTRHWDEVAQIWNAVAEGDSELSVPAYDGGMFSRDPAVSRVGAAIAKVRLSNEFFEPALRSLLLEDYAPVDFRSLGVREFGTIYEGLLESELSVAEQDLVVDRKGSYVPLKGKQTPEVRKGDVYLHNKSGARKSSGSYFTKEFAVDHLLSRALVPALADHLERVSALSEVDAADSFFDFRVADIAMGSGHFLVAAIDQIEKAFADYLAKPDNHGAAGVRAELTRLKEAARKQLGPLADETPFEDSQLLRRLIARRCIYGVDLNPLAVELARLSIWIHTFVPGLPLSVLDHNLVVGNALVGVGTVDEIREKFEDAGTSLFPVDAHSLLSAAEKPLRRLANLSDVTLADVAKARDAMTEAKAAIGPTEALCDIITGQRLDPTIPYQFENWERDRDSVQRSQARHKALKTLSGLHALHFPIAFPEVFLRRRSGFDVIIGNPPWKSPVVHEVAFWARHFPGLRGLSQADSERERGRLQRARPDLSVQLEAEIVESAKMRTALTSGAFPGMGTGDPDLYKAFEWRFWNLIAEGEGRLAVVLPRSAFAAQGSEHFRKAMFVGARDVDLTMLLNNKQWVFEEVHPQYTIGLTAITRGQPIGDTIGLRGPFANLRAFEVGHEKPATRLAPAEVLSWNDAGALPLLPTEEALPIFLQLRRAPRLDFDDGLSWRARPYGEAHSKTCKDYMLKPGKGAEGAWPVFKGESFNLEVCETGDVYGYARPATMAGWLNGLRAKQTAGSAYAEFSREWARDPKSAPWLFPRVVIRDVARATDTRTVIASVVPPQVFLTDKAPYFLFPRGDTADQVFLYGILRSIPLDWYARRHVETGLKFYLVNSFPIPRTSRNDPLWKRTIALAGRLASPDERFADWAKKVGVEHGTLAADEKQDMIDELDAVVARLYGLDERQLVHIFETFHEGWDYEDRLTAVLKHFTVHGGMPYAAGSTNSPQ